eukprot:15454885-Alexandrium_andersonii.AAC.1
MRVASSLSGSQKPSNAARSSSLDDDRAAALLGLGAAASSAGASSRAVARRLGCASSTPRASDHSLGNT